MRERERVYCERGGDVEQGINWKKEKNDGKISCHFCVFPMQFCGWKSLQSKECDEKKVMARVNYEWEAIRIGMGEMEIE